MNKVGTGEGIDCADLVQQLATQADAKLVHAEAMRHHALICEDAIRAAVLASGEKSSRAMESVLVGCCTSLLGLPTAQVPVPSARAALPCLAPCHPGPAGLAASLHGRGAQCPEAEQEVGRAGQRGGARPGARHPDTDQARVILTP